ncbi:MAG TPA: class I SAM-dependent methyltransferase [Gaiellaceae bacterium]|nr:class I SAM-dependent methyltransferase [Gaiellaceae bacterium]
MSFTAGQRFARLVTDAVVRRPRLWRLFRGPFRRMFDGLAPVWDSTRVSPAHLAPLEAAFERVPTPPGRILDVGTGSGAAARAAARRWPDAEVVGVDLSARMVEEARRNATSERERYEVADASALPFADGSFDLVAQLNAIPFFDELARVTAPGGRVVVAFSRGAATPIWVPLERVRQELARRGFDGFEEIAGGAGRALLAVRGRVS